MVTFLGLFLLMMLMKGKSAISNCSSSCNLLPDLLLSCACGESLQSSYYLKIKRWGSKFDNISLMKKIILNLLKKKKSKTCPTKAYKQQHQQQSGRQLGHQSRSSRNRRQNSVHPCAWWCLWKLRGFTHKYLCCFMHAS